MLFFNKKTVSFILLAFITLCCAPELSLSQSSTIPEYSGQTACDKKKTGAVIIFDIGEVLLTTDKFKAASHLGIGDCALYFLKGSFAVTKHIRSKFFKLMLAVQPYNSNSTYNTRDDQGELLPPLMCQWLQEPQKKGNAVRAELMQYINDNPDFFAHKTEEALVKRLIDLVFNPVLFTQSRQVIHSTAKILQKLAARNHTIILCSNWDAESYSLVKKQFAREIFDHIDGEIISGYEGSLKPEKTIFKKLIERFNLNPDKQICLFVDDQKENRKAARQYGIIAIHPDKLERTCKELCLL